MGDISARNFGLLIAYLVPGFIAVMSAGGIVPTFGVWLATTSSEPPTIGGVLYITLASIGAGMLASSIRFIVIDTIHHKTGLVPPALDFSKLQGNLEAFGLLVEFHYRYYQFCSNTLVAVAFAYGVRVVAGCPWCGGIGWTDFGFVVIEAVLFATSRDTLRKYYARLAEVLQSGRAERSETMSNGCGKEHGPKKDTNKPAEGGKSTETAEKKSDAASTSTKGEKPRA